MRYESDEISLKPKATNIYKSSKDFRNLKILKKESFLLNAIQLLERLPYKMWLI